MEDQYIPDIRLYEDRENVVMYLLVEGLKIPLSYEITSHLYHLLGRHLQDREFGNVLPIAGYSAKRSHEWSPPITP